MSQHKHTMPMEEVWHAGDVCKVTGRRKEMFGATWDIVTRIHDGKEMYIMCSEDKQKILTQQKKQWKEEQEAFARLHKPIC